MEAIVSFGRQDYKSCAFTIAPSVFFIFLGGTTPPDDLFMSHLKLCDSKDLRVFSPSPFGFELTFQQFSPNGALRFLSYVFICDYLLQKPLHCSTLM